MSKVVIYSSRLCGYCFAARRLLEEKAAQYQEISVDGRPDTRQQLRELSGQSTVPQIWIGETHVGGYTDLLALEQKGELDALLMVS